MEYSQEIKRQESYVNSEDMVRCLLMDDVDPNMTAEVLKPAAEDSAAVQSEAPSNENMVDEMVVDEEEDDEEEDGEEEGSEEDGSSNLSDGGDLRQDLEDALRVSGFSFTGNFYHDNILTTAPNPCLHISGLGIVGIPLSEREAKAIVSCATLSPFGHGEHTTVDKGIRDTWEIEPARIVFGNPEWSKYINGVVLLDVCKALGVKIGKFPPKMELYNLLLCGIGSDFLPRQDTQKSNGMFATVFIVLPSTYSGGQVIVSHASTTKTIDFAPNSLLSTAVLAWYTDVEHEAKPITSGYRLALTYKLIHIASPGVAQPMLPEICDSVDRLRRVLTKWREDKYTEVPELPLLAYLLDHKYSSLDLKGGIKALKGADVHLVTTLRNIAEELGYMIGLATLEKRVSGPADNCGDGYYHRKRYCYSDEEDEDEVSAPGMIEEEDSTTSILGLVDLKGISLLPFGRIKLDDCNLIPSDPFEDKLPDNVEYDFGDVTYLYCRTVLVLMHENDVDGVCFSVAGIPYALQKLAAFDVENSQSPTANMKIWVDRIVSKSSQLNRKQALKMLDLAMKWKDADIFKTIMKATVCTLSVVNVDVLSKAWKIFSFEAVRPSFEQALARSPAFSEKVKLIYMVRSKTSNEDKQIVRPWCKKEIDKTFASYTQPDVRDMPVISSVIRSAWGPFVKILLPTFLKRPTYSFLIALVKALQEARQSILDQLEKAKAKTGTSTEAERGSPDAEYEFANESQGDGKTPVDKVIEQALAAATKQWSHAPASYNTQIAQTGKVNRIVEIIELTIISDNLDICRTLFIDILKSTGTSSEKFTQVYTPLIPRLRTLLQSRRLDLCTPPFVDLFQILIGSYLRDVLGKKGQHLNPRLRKIGCGCPDCLELDRFILDPMAQKTIFRLAQKRRAHLERQIATASDLCTCDTVRWGSPHGLQVTKCPEVVEACTWDHRQKAARKFLSSFGTDEIIKKIMGIRYTDVVAAINGVTPFGATKLAKDGPSASTSKGTPAAPTQKADAHRPAGVGAASSSHADSSGSRITSNTGATNLTSRNVVASKTQTARPAFASGVPAQIVGKKRKSNPTVDLDLT